MAITFINKSRLENNLWVEPRGAENQWGQSRLILK